MVKNIIFDLGNVIINFDKDKIIDKFANNSEEKKYLIEENFNSLEWKKVDLGIISNEDAISIIDKRNNYKFSDLTNIFWNKWYKVQTINEDIVSIAKKLKQNGYNIYVLSNMGIETYNFFKNHEFFKLLSGVIISSYCHIKKPDKKIFELLLNKYNLKAEECLLIDDDDTNKTFEVANQIGILGRRVNPNDCYYIEKMLKDFKLNF
ncbi:MAG: HAD hydrolase-like protein [Bacilli bacterium]|nr:HAD hydrolase-like protein [Bacilli bacterium]